MAGYDPEQRTRADEIWFSLGGCTVEEVKVQGRTAYLRLSKPGDEDRYVSVDAASVGDARSVWPTLPDLRHTFASRAVKAMPSLSDVQALLGHADITTTQRYVHHVPGARDAERLAAAFAEPDDLERAVSQPVGPNPPLRA